ncbi:MAG: prephenate dehydrogenase/arogenate dehydrogenase family protein [Actinomycetota bacterium]
MTSPERVAVVGTGLIGTSIALAARRAGDEVRGMDLDPGHAAMAAERAGIEVTGDLEGSVADATIVVVATPVGATVDAVVRVLAANDEAIVTDVASVKHPIATGVRARVADALDRARFIPGHPMGGTERTGPTWASAAVLDGIPWVVAPDEATPEAAVAHLETWIRRLGAAPMRIPAGRHDRLVATVSHLPQVASTALMDLAAGREAGEPDSLVLAAGCFRDLTRLAASSPDLWAEILVGNRDEVVAAIDAFVVTLTEVRDAVADGEREAVRTAFARAKEARLALAARPKVRAGVAVLQVPIPDRPGALAEVTGTLRDVNIEDLQIVHSAEGGGGVLHITLGLDALDAATGALEAAGHPSLRLA